MWSERDRLILYRPYLRANAEEERLFGANRAVEQCLAHTVVEQPDPCLVEFLPAAGPDAEVFANYHMLYGSVSVICKIETDTSGSSSIPAGVVPLRSPTSAIQVGDRNVSVVGTVLSLRSIPLPVPTNAVGSDSSDAVIEMWVHCAATNAGKFAPSHGQQLLRIRCHSKAFFTRAKESGLFLLGPITTGAVQAGQSVFISSGISVLSACPLSAVASETKQREGDGLSANQVQRWMVGFGGDSTPVLNCAWGPSASNLFHTHAQHSASATASAGVEDGTESTSSEGCKIVPLCCLPALACSPSLFLPTSLVAAMSVVTGPSSAAGCVLVQASIQPMHPSVRLLGSAVSHKEKVQQHANEAYEASNISYKRQRTEDSLNGTSDVYITEQGYQLVSFLGARLKAYFIYFCSYAESADETPRWLG